MRIVSLINPSPCGAYQVHLALAHRLAQRGCSLSWLASGAFAAAIQREGGFETSSGDLVAAHTANMTVRTRALVDWLRALSPDLVLCHAIGDKIDFNAIRYFPASIPRILLLHSSTVGHYRAARAVRDYVNATVAISRRIEEDLVSSYGFRGHRVRLIANGVNLDAFTPRAIGRHPGDRVRILVHSRISHASKGILWVADILERLAQVSHAWQCTISGNGDDLPILRQRIAQKNLLEHVVFTGWTPSPEVPALMSRHDLLLFPSKYEGFGLTLVEAMAAGCVPVASRLAGVTDAIIQNNVDGVLFSIGDLRIAAQILANLIADRDRLSSLSRQAQTSAQRYGLKAMADQYYELFHEVVQSPGQLRSPESLDHCELAGDLKPAWWNRLPAPIKDHLRVVRENVRAVIPVP